MDRGLESFDIGEVTERLENDLILQPAQSPTFPSLHLRHITAHSPTFPSLYLRHSSFSKPSVASSTSQLFLKPFRSFTYVTAHSPALPSLCLRHSSFSNPSVPSSTSHLILQPFRCFTYVTVHSPTLLSLLLHHNLFDLIHLTSRPCCSDAKERMRMGWDGESNGKLSYVFIPSKTATLVPEFPVEDLPLSRTGALVPEFGRTL